MAAFGQRLFSKVGLTDDQKAQMKEVVAKHRPALQTLRQQLRAARDEITDKLLRPDQLALASRMKDQLRTLHTQMQSVLGGQP